MSVDLLDEVALDERDGRYLRQAIALADKARARGDRSLGCPPPKGKAGAADAVGPAGEGV